MDKKRLNRDELFVMSSMTLSQIGVENMLQKLESYVSEVNRYSGNIENCASIENGGDLSALFSVSRIRDLSNEMLYGLDIMRSSLDRYVFADEDIPRRIRRHHGLRGRGRRRGVGL